MELVALVFCFWKSYIILIGFYSPFFYILFFNTDFEIKVQLSLLAIRSFDGRAAAVVQRLSFFSYIAFRFCALFILEWSEPNYDDSHRREFSVELKSSPVGITGISIAEAVELLRYGSVDESIYVVAGHYTFCA